jgi:hypothetical protein
MSKKAKTIIGISIALAICICAVGFVILGMPIMLQATPFLGIADCGWDDTALAWIDENQNGVWDNNEKPLAGVKFVADDIQHDFDAGHEAISDANGKAWVAVFPVACNGFDEIEIVLSAIPPDSYEPTTPREISIPQEAAQNAENDNFLFGFISKDQ